MVYITNALNYKKPQKIGGSNLHPPHVFFSAKSPFPSQLVNVVEDENSIK